MAATLETLTQTRAPLTPEDRAALAATARTAATVGKVMGAIALALVLYAIVSVLQGDDMSATIFAVMMGFFGVILLAIAIWLVRRTAADSQASDKVIYVGTVTGKRVVQVDQAPPGPGHPPSTDTRYLIALDGVEFRLNRSLYALVEPGHRVELHCLRTSEPFRVVRVG